jgi:hypothetical protein
MGQRSYLYDQTDWSLASQSVRNRSRTPSSVIGIVYRICSSISVLQFWFRGSQSNCSKSGKLGPKAPTSQDKYFNTSASKYRILPVSRRTALMSFGQLFFSRCFRNSPFQHFFEIDQIWRGHKIRSFDPGITNSSAMDSRWPQLYVCTHSNATKSLRKACSERTLLQCRRVSMKWKRSF